MGEDHEDRSDATGETESSADETTGDGGLEPSGGHQRVVSGESVDDAVASLRSTKPSETNDGDETDGTDETDVTGDADGTGETNETDEAGQTDDGSTAAMVDVDELAADAGPLAGRLQPDPEPDATTGEPDELSSDSSESTPRAVDKTTSEPDVADPPERERADAPTRADDADATASDAPDDTQSTGLLARVKRFFFG